MGIHRENRQTNMEIWGPLLPWFTRIRSESKKWEIRE